MLTFKCFIHIQIPNKHVFTFYVNLNCKETVEIVASHIFVVVVTLAYFAVI